MEDPKFAQNVKILERAKLDFVTDESFKADLKSQVFQKYLSINVKTMEDQKKSFWSRKALKGAMAFTFLAVAGATAFGLNYLNNDSKQSQDTPKDQKLGVAVAYYEGDLEKGNSEGGWNDANDEVVINEGDSLRVAGEGRAVLNFDDGSSIRLNSDSAVSFLSLDPQNIVVANDSGDVYARVINLDREFSVTSGDITYQSLGTAYNTVNKSDLKGVEVYHSKVSVKVKGEEKVKVEEGNKYYFKSKNADEQEKVVALSSDVAEKNEFIKWNKELDQKDYSGDLGFFKETTKVETQEQPKQEEPKQETKTSTSPAPAPAPTTGGSITITSVNPTTGAFKVFWSTASLDASQGFKVVFNKTGNPTYGVDTAHYLGAGSTPHVVRGLASGTYYVRVCRYTGSGCDTYSNQVSVNVTGATPISSISLSAAGGTAVSWNTNGGTASEGFKLVWSKNSGATYPTRTGDFAGFYEANKTYGDISWGGNDGPGTYFVRVCEYKDGQGCVLYSNEITVALP